MSMVLAGKLGCSDNPAGSDSGDETFHIVPSPCREEPLNDLLGLGAAPAPSIMAPPAVTNAPPVTPSVDVAGPCAGPEAAPAVAAAVPPVVDAQRSGGPLSMAAIRAALEEMCASAVSDVSELLCCPITHVRSLITLFAVASLSPRRHCLHWCMPVAVLANRQPRPYHAAQV